MTNQCYKKSTIDADAITSVHGAGGNHTQRQTTAELLQIFRRIPAAFTKTVHNSESMDDCLTVKNAVGVLSLLMKHSIS